MTSHRAPEPADDAADTPGTGDRPAGTPAPAEVAEPAGAASAGTPSTGTTESAPRVTPGPVETLGTPGTDTAVTVLLLGSGELGKEVTIAFQRLGVEVVAVDRYAGAPAHQVAHAAEVIDMTDAAAVRAVIEKHRPRYVLPEIEAIATDALEGVERDGLAEVIPSAKGVAATLDREGIRRLADEELGLPTSSYLFAGSEEELATAAYRVGYPCVVKPVMSSSGKGQSVVRSADDIPAAWETAMTGGRVASARVIVEQLIDFDYEVTLLTVRAIDPATGELATYFCEPIGHRQSGGDYVESWQPQPMDPEVLGASRSIAARIVAAMGAPGTLSGRGIFGVELFIKGDEVYFSEVSPRPHDTGLVTMASQRLSEFELHARAVLGLPVDTSLAAPGASAVIYGGIDAPGIKFAGVAEALADPAVDLRLFGKPESYVRRRMGVAVATGADVEQARSRAGRAAGLVTPLAADAPLPAEASTDPVEGSTEPAQPAQPPATTVAPLPPQVAQQAPARPAPAQQAQQAPAQPAPGPSPVPGRPPQPPQGGTARPPHPGPGRPPARGPVPPPPGPPGPPPPGRTPGPTTVVRRPGPPAAPAGRGPAGPSGPRPPQPPPPSSPPPPPQR
ncbi:formate-dependent phosphoribosylglycinamide formyltransferase [Gordonia sp. VNK21]|uniref:formate-dependent phosphoribosylglycinamide formyltransferase n=1 Tax=Gordonia sp. VNK21 TaxID=3382483 RepID=UPI0038D491E4